eukprot:3708841-Amphidinium_carterae.1
MPRFSDGVLSCLELNALVMEMRLSWIQAWPLGLHVLSDTGRGSSSRTLHRFKTPSSHSWVNEATHVTADAYSLPFLAAQYCEKLLEETA